MKLLVLAAVVALNISIALGSGWTYVYKGPHTGVKDWCHVSEECCGDAQSPIDIPADVKRSSTTLTLKNYDKKFDMEALNNGHTVGFGLKNPADAPRFTGEHIDTEYVFDSFHFHWGSPNNSIGSEHTIRGVAARMELHMVHYKSSFKSIKDALASNKPGDLAVLGTLIQEYNGVDNYKYEAVISALPSLKYEGQKAHVKPVALQDLLPSKYEKAFYTYSGSLTTPTCNEEVFWTVFRSKVTLSKNQISKFFDLYSTEEGQSPAEKIQGNFRPAQDLNGRVVTYYKH